MFIYNLGVKNTVQDIFIQLFNIKVRRHLLLSRAVTFNIVVGIFHKFNVC